MRTKREQAAHLLQFYMAKAWEAAGLKWQGDNDAETAAVVDLIIDACTARDHAQAQERRYVQPGPGKYAEHRITVIPKGDGSACVYEGTPGITTGAPVFDGPLYAAAKYADDRHADYTGNGWVTIQN